MKLKEQVARSERAQRPAYHDHIRLRPPASSDGFSVHQLISQCPPLDQNSVYCNLLQCTHLADTCVVAEMDEELVGFASAYRKPELQDVLFVWQIAVADQARGLGLAKRMLFALLTRPELHDVRFIETTISPSNVPSTALFQRLADDLNAELSETVLFSKDKHFDGQHEDEILFRIGPFQKTQVSQ